MARDLHLVDCRSRRVATAFWQQLTHKFIDAKALTLRLDHRLNAIAITGEESLGAAAVAAFVNLDRLELDLRHKAPCSSQRSAAAMANLLHCCPSIRHLWIKLTCVSARLLITIFSATVHRLDFDKSVDLFVHRSSKPMLSLDDDDEEEEEEVSDIAVLSGQSFECLQSTLKRVILQFRMEIEDQLLWIAACQLLRRKRHGS
uniref:Uncharacterized protein n=1 Tax=Oryza meridionalis TaxID=40149 RepID=A0A0E0F800_9ORYZ